MQVLLHTDPHIDGTQAMAAHLQTVVADALHRFGERVTRVEAHLSSADGQTRSADGAIQCALEARLVGLEPVFVKEHAGNAHQAIEGAVRKLERAVATVLAKHDPRRPRHQDDAVAEGLVAPTEPS